MNCSRCGEPVGLVHRCPAKKPKTALVVLSVVALSLVIGAALL